MITNQTIADELRKQIELWDTFKARDDRGDLIENVVLATIQTHLERLAEQSEAKAERLVDPEHELENGWEWGYLSGRRREAREAAQVLRDLADGLTVHNTKGVSA